MSERFKPESMSAHPEHLELETLIRSSVASYGEAEPDSDLAQRILLRVAAEPKRTSLSQRLHWAVTLPIAACVTVLFALVQVGWIHKPEESKRQIHVASQPRNENLSAGSGPAQAANPRAKRERLPRNANLRAANSSTESDPLPKLDVFPMPKPLSPSEQALVQFVERSPAIARNSLVDAPNQDDAPLSVAAIQIQPLETPELGMN